MNSDVLTAAISAGAAVVTAVVALVLNHRGFTMLENRINSIDTRLSQELRDVRTDLKQFFQIQADFDKRLSRIEDKLNLPPK